MIKTVPARDKEILKRKPVVQRHVRGNVGRVDCRPNVGMDQG